jgi:Tol biopolymer transport system component
VGGRSLSVGNVVMSADGRWVAFVSANRDLSAQDTQGHQEIYLHDMTTASTSLASLSSGGTAGNGDSLLPSLTGDGGVLVFESTADNLDGRDATAGQCPADVGGNCSNVYLHQNIGVAT